MKGPGAIFRLSKVSARERALMNLVMPADELNRGASSGELHFPASWAVLGSY
jgi:hypothetical protein